MKKDKLKTEDLKTIDVAVLEEILGGAQITTIDATRVGIAVIAQAPFSSFYHS